MYSCIGMLLIVDHNLSKYQYVNLTITYLQV